LTVIVVRFPWHMSFNAVIQVAAPPARLPSTRPMLRPSVGRGLVISWAGMRGIVTLAAADGAPAGVSLSRPDVLTSFSVA